MRLLFNLWSASCSVRNHPKQLSNSFSLIKTSPSPSHYYSATLWHSVSMASRILRRSLALPSSSTPASPNLPSPSSFVLGCKKLVLSYSEIQGSALGMRQFLSSGHVQQLANQYPGVEIVVKREEGKHPILRALYRMSTFSTS